MTEHILGVLYRIEWRLKTVEAFLRTLITAEAFMSVQLDALATQVAANTSAEQSAAALLGQLADLIKQNATDPAALVKLADDLKASQTKLAQAIVANTPAA